MTQEDKELLLKDLCARSPYGVMMGNKTLKETSYRLSMQDVADAEFDDEFDDLPYLRSMSSMTEKEFKELKDTWEYLKHRPDVCVPSVASYDWLNAHHFDYRGLIEKDLAIAVTKENNLIRKLGEYINNHPNARVEETIYYILCAIVYGK